MEMTRRTRYFVRGSGPQSLVTCEGEGRLAFGFGLLQLMCDGMGN